MKKTSPSIAAAYIRVSTDDQIEFSPDSQLKKIQEYAKQHQICLPSEYIFLDEGISGRNVDNRPAFLRMIQLARQKPRPFDQILVWKFSRFARNRQDSIFYKSMLRKECGIDVISITEQLSDDPTSILIEALLEAMDEYYSINLAQEVRRGMNEKFSRGGVVGPPPFGYCLSDGKFIPDPSTAPFVPMIFSDFVAGMSCRQIASKLNELQIQTIRGNPFEARTVRYILGNPFYLGMQRRHLTLPMTETPMTVVSSMHSALISDETFTEAQRLLKLSSRSRTFKTRPAHPVHMLDGLVRCSHCNATLTRSGKGQSLQCCKYTRGQCVESHSVSLPYITAIILQQIQRDLQQLPDRQLHLAFPTNTHKKSRKKNPAFSKNIYFPDICLLLQTDHVPGKLKNRILHAFINKIVFSRKNHTIQIYYKS